MTHGILRNDIQCKFKHFENISDHKMIEVMMNDQWLDPKK